MNVQLGLRGSTTIGQPGRFRDYVSTEDFTSAEKARESASGQPVQLRGEVYLGSSKRKPTVYCSQLKSSSAHEAPYLT